MTDPDAASCPFCFPAPDRVAFEHRLVRALWDAFPASPGHLLVAPRRHVATWFDASEEERAAILKALDEASPSIRRPTSSSGATAPASPSSAART